MRRYALPFFVDTPLTSPACEWQIANEARQRRYKAALMRLKDGAKRQLKLVKEKPRETSE